MAKILSAIKSIRKNCIECSGGSAKEVAMCVIHDCWLYPYRMGKNPNRKGLGNKSHLKGVRRGSKKSKVPPLDGGNESSKAESNPVLGD